MIAILTPSKTDTYIDRLVASLDRSEPNLKRPTRYRLIVGDNGLTEACRARHPTVEFVNVPRPFVFSKAVNLCAEKAAGCDLLVMNDDAAMASGGAIKVLEDVARRVTSPTFGILSARIDGGAGNEDQMQIVPPGEIRLTRKCVCFIAALIPAHIWSQIGPLDERFEGYGWEDTDYCRRVVEAGYSLGIIGAVVATHGYRDMAISGTFRPTFGLEKQTQLYHQNRELFEAKWGDGPQLGVYGSQT